MVGNKFNFMGLTRALGLAVVLGVASIGAWAQPAARPQVQEEPWSTPGSASADAWGTPGSFGDDTPF